MDRYDLKEYAALTRIKAFNVQRLQDQISEWDRVQDS